MIVDTLLTHSAGIVSAVVLPGICVSVGWWLGNQF